MASLMNYENPVSLNLKGIVMGETDFIKFVDFEPAIKRICDAAERDIQVRLRIDRNILSEVKQYANNDLNKFGLPRPNVAKFAGVFSFWFRKLKPISYADDSQNYYPAINELVGLISSLAICEEYKDDLSNPDFCVAKIPVRLVKDWINGLRMHSYSPSSLTMAFELIASKY